MTHLPTLHDAYQAHARIRPLIKPTQLMVSEDLARKCGAHSVHLKLECLQNTGAFKVRGAANKILSLPEKEAARGVATFSTGNHGKAVAFVAGQTGIAATVCLSEHVPQYRAEMIRRLGANVVVKGRSQDEAERHYHSLVKAHGLIPVVPFDDPMIIAGQGTISLEVLSSLPETQVLLVPLSGGGLLAGMAMVAKTINPDIQIIGLSLERSPAMLESLNQGKPVQVEEKHTVADSLLGGIGLENHYTLAMVDRYVDGHIRLGEDEIMDGMFYLFEAHRIVAEGAASVGVAALLNGRVDVAGKRVVTVVTGSTVDTAAYLKVIQQRFERASAS